MSRWTQVLAAMVIIALVATGCSGGKTPLTPASGGDLTANSANQVTKAQTHLWGLYDVYIDIPTQTATAAVNRSAMFAANVVNFLNNKVSNLAFTINGTPIDPAFIDVDIDVAISHPFPGLHQYDGYDVRGIFMGDGSSSLVYGSNLRYAKYGSTNQVMKDYNLTDDGNIYGDPDGYTRWWNQSEFITPGLFGYTQGKLGSPGYTETATLNPYKYFADGLAPADDLWTWLAIQANADQHGVFSAGSTNTRNYYLRFPTPSPGVKYQYAVVADWIAEDVHPANALEAIALNTHVTPDIYFVDAGNKGGDLILDISVFNWSTVQIESQNIWLESNVLTAPYQLTGSEMVPTGGGANYSTYHVEVAAAKVSGVTGNEYWVIVETSTEDYTNSFGATNNVPYGTPLAAFFRYDLYVSPTPYCSTTFVSIDPDKGPIGAAINDAGIECSALEAGPSLGVRLTKSGKSPIVGTDVKLVDGTHMTADFSLVGAAKGLWNVEVTNGCGGTPGIGAGAFEVIGGWTIDAQGNLPTPLPTSLTAHFCVVGSSSNKGVFYHYTTGGNYLIYKYPLDYATGGVLFRTLTGATWGGPTDFFYNTQSMGVIQMIINGIACLGGDAALPCGAGWYPPFTTDSIPVWTTNTGVFSDGLLPYTNDLAGCGKFKDYDTEWTATGAVWGFWADPSHLGLYFGDQFNIHSPYGPNDYSEFTGYVPYDTSGGIDGLVDDTYVTRMALDSAPVGLEDPYDIIFYYLESPPATPAIEVIQNIKSMPFPTPLATIKTFTGTPVDVTVYNAYGYIADAAGNWVVALEKNATSWQIAAFDQNGNLIARYPTPISGNPIEIDNDITNHKLHVWYDASGTLKYVIFIYA